MAPRKAQRSLPWNKNYVQLAGNELDPASTSSKTVDVYYIDGSGTKTFLGVAKDRMLLARFSSAASDQLRVAAEGSKKTDATSEVIVQTLDHAAGLLVLRWINKSNMLMPRPLVFDVPKQFSFELYCKIHRATHVFYIRRELRDRKVRGSLVEHIGKLRETCFDDFKVAHEQLEFDPPLMYLMRSQVISVHLVSGVAVGEYDRIVAYCATQGMRLLKEMDAIEMEIRTGLNGEQEMTETPFVINKSVEEKTFLASLSKKPIVQRKKVTLGRIGVKNSGKAQLEDAKTLQKVSYAEALRF
jgi:hypothetical protein